jgi:peptide/nickel transport system substrate-binding protein
MGFDLFSQGCTRRTALRLLAATTGIGLLGPGPALAQGPAAAPARAPKKGGQLTIGQPGDLSAFEPSIQLPSAFPLYFNLFDTLVQYDKKMVPQPYLVTAWEIGRDGLSIKMTLRKGVKFHTGRDLTAEDVNFSLKRVQDPKIGALYRFMADRIAKADAPDPYTIVWQMNRPYPGIFDLMSKLHVVDKENIDKTDFTKKGTGSGPFIFERFVPGEYMQLKKNPNYWRQGLPYLDGIRVNFVPDVTALTTQLEAGAIDLALRPSLVDAVRMKSNPKFRVDMGQIRALYDILLFTKKGPFTNKKVRQAVNWTINREQYWKTIFKGIGDWTCIPYPSQSQAYFPDLAKSITPDLPKAKKLMAEAGVPNGFETSILTTRMRQQEYLDLAVLYQQDLAKIGIKARIEDVELAQYEQRHLNEGFETAIHAYARANYDPDTLIGGALAWTPKIGMTRFGDPEYIRLFEDAGSSYNMAERKPKYRKLVEYILDESFTLPICYNPELYMYASSVHDVTTDVDFNLDCSGTWLDK